MLAVAGHDPSGAAGVQADIETIAAMGCGCATLITALTVQNTARFVAFAPQSATALREQAAVLLEDVVVGAVKIGMVGTVAIATELAQLVQQLGPLPVVLDPVLQSSTAGALVAPQCEPRLLDILASQVTVLTPNQDEALTLTQAATVDDAAELLLQQGCTNVLVTGLASGVAEQLHVSRLYRHTGAPLEFRVPRLEGVWHGSGCTLSAALTAGLAQGHSVPRATRIAVNYTWECLGNARQHGRGQLHPRRSGRAVAAPRLRPGLYAIADADTLPDARLIECTEQVLRGGAVAVQYRNKQGAHPARHHVARALQRLCRHYGACFIINDDPVLARELGADGVHLGQHDADPVVVREWLGADALIGVSCYDDLQRACAAETRPCRLRRLWQLLCIADPTGCGAATTQSVAQGKTGTRRADCRHRRCDREQCPGITYGRRRSGGIGTRPVSARYPGAACPRIQPPVCRAPPGGAEPWIASLRWHLVLW